MGLLVMMCLFSLNKQPDKTACRSGVVYRQRVRKGNFRESLAHEKKKKTGKESHFDQGRKGSIKVRQGKGRQRTEANIPGCSPSLLLYSPLLVPSGMNCFQMLQCLRQILGVSLHDYLWNKIMRLRCEQQATAKEEIQRWRLRCLQEEQTSLEAAAHTVIGAVIRSCGQVKNRQMDWRLNLKELTFIHFQEYSKIV